MVIKTYYVKSVSIQGTKISLWGKDNRNKVIYAEPGWLIDLFMKELEFDSYECYTFVEKVRHLGTIKLPARLVLVGLDKIQIINNRSIRVYFTGGLKG